MVFWGESSSAVKEGRQGQLEFRTRLSDNDLPCRYLKIITPAVLILCTVNINLLHITENLLMGFRILCLFMAFLMTKWSSCSNIPFLVFSTESYYWLVPLAVQPDVQTPEDWRFLSLSHPLSSLGIHRPGFLGADRLIQCDAVPGAEHANSFLGCGPNTGLSVDGGDGHRDHVSSRSRKWELEGSCYQAPSFLPALHQSKLKPCVFSPHGRPHTQSAWLR